MKPFASRVSLPWILCLLSVVGKEIEQLYHRFKKLDRTRSGVISRQDFQLISELSLNPMAPRILALFQTDSGEEAIAAGGVTFDVFVKTLNFFHERTPLHVKIEKLFQAYDIDGDGIISERDLQQMLKYYVGPHISEVACRVLVRKTMSHALSKCTNNAGGAKGSNSATKTKRLAPSGTSQSGSCDDPVEIGRGLTLDDFKRVIQTEGIEALNVHIPIPDR